MIAQVLTGESHSFRINPDRVELDAPPASATYDVRTDRNVQLQSGSATVDSVSTTVDVVTSNQTFTLASAVGVVAGRWYWMERSDGVSSSVLVSKLSGTTVELADPPNFAVESAQVFQGLEVSFELDSANTTTRGFNHRVDWSVTDTGGRVYRPRTQFDIVVQSIPRPMTAERAKAYITQNYSRSVKLWKSARFEQLADAASSVVIDQLRKGGRHVALMGTTQPLLRAGMAALRAELVDHGIAPQGESNTHLYRMQQQREMERIVELAVQAMSSYDANNDDLVESGTETSTFTTTILRRR